MFLVNRQLIGHAKIGLNRIADSIQTTISGGADNSRRAVLLDGNLCQNPLFLFEMALRNPENISGADVIFLENLINLRRM